MDNNYLSDCLAELETRSDNEGAFVPLVIDMLKLDPFDLEAQRLSSNLYHRMLRERVTATVSQYLAEFGSRLTDPVRAFIECHTVQLEELCQSYRCSEDYRRILDAGLLSAVRFYDTYVLRNDDDSCLESIEHMFMRVAVFCACQCTAEPCLERALKHAQEMYGQKSWSDMHTLQYFFEAVASQRVCCATPVYRAAGVRGGNLASCFIVRPDLSSEQATVRSLEEKITPLLASHSGIGVDVTGFDQQGKNVQSLMRLLNAQVEYFNDQSARPVSVAAYLELWHAQVLEFLNSRLPENSDRAASVFQGLCIPELFFRRYLEDSSGIWHFFEPSKAGRLRELYGDAFEAEYERLVQENAYCSFMSFKSLMYLIIHTLVKTGSPYIVVKEAMNKHHWREPSDCAIAASNLCAEIIQESHLTTAVCNLANVCLPLCMIHNTRNYDMCSWAVAASVEEEKTDAYEIAAFSLEKLKHSTQMATLIVNCCISGGLLPTEAARESQGARSMGIGVQGLADVFAELNWEYLSPRSEALDRQIFETMYFTAVEMSCDIVEYGGGKPFEGFRQSKLAKGIFHCDEWGVNTDSLDYRWTLASLRQRVKTFGVYNSQFIALMPTAGSSQLTGFSESFYPFFANVTSKASHRGEILRPNFTFLKCLLPEDVPEVRRCHGEVTKMPPELARRYSRFRSAFDLDAFQLMRRAAVRAPFVDQSQSNSIFLKEKSAQSAKFVKDLLIQGFREGLKTIVYYCRIQKSTDVASLDCVVNSTKDPESRHCLATDANSAPLVHADFKWPQIQADSQSAGPSCESCQ